MRHTPPTRGLDAESTVKTNYRNNTVCTTASVPHLTLVEL